MAMASLFRALDLSTEFDEAHRCNTFRLQMDVTDKASIKKAKEQLLRDEGKLNVLVNKYVTALYRI